MTRHIKGNFNEHQLCMIPYEYQVEEGSIARVINDLVNSFELDELGFKNAKPKATGRPPYNPSDLTKLYLYGYYEGIRSSRKLHKECKRNIEVMWLIDGLKPSFKTIAAFRSENTDALIKLFYHFSNLCNQLGLFGKEMVAIDGSKFRANNSKLKNYTKGKIERQINYFKVNAKKYIDLLDENDEADSTTQTELSALEIKEKIKKYQNKLKEAEKLKDRIENEGQISTIDPDARLMTTNNNGSSVAHNVQIAVDSKHHFVTAVDVTSSRTDQHELYNMASKSKKIYDEMRAYEGVATTKEHQLIALADKGYYAGEELKLCEEDEINTIVCPVNKSNKYEYNLDDFTYIAKEDCYICPCDQKLKCISKESTVDKAYRNKEACLSCTEKSKCTNSKKGRRILRKPNTIYLETAKERYKEGIDLYKKRQEIVEHVFGTIKRSLGFNHLLLRGNKKVKAESHMHFLVYNLKRTVNVIGAEELRAVLG